MSRAGAIARPIAALGALGALGTPAAAAGPGNIEVLTRACLDRLPGFQGAPAAFEAAGWSENEDLEAVLQARHFGVPGGDEAMLRDEFDTGSASAADCTVLIATSVAGGLASVVAMSFGTGQDCVGDLR